MITYIGLNKVNAVKCIVTFEVDNVSHVLTFPVLFFIISYWANLKLWFKQKISKEEFDIEARRLLAQENGKKDRKTNVVLVGMLFVKCGSYVFSSSFLCSTCPQ